MTRRILSLLAYNLIYSIKSSSEKCLHKLVSYIMNTDTFTLLHHRQMGILDLLAAKSRQLTLFKLYRSHQIIIVGQLALLPCSQV